MQPAVLRNNRLQRQVQSHYCWKSTISFVRTARRQQRSELKQLQTAAKNKRRRQQRKQRRAESLLSESETASTSADSAEPAVAAQGTAARRGVQRVGVAARAGPQARTAPRAYAAAARCRSRSRARVAADNDLQESAEAADEQDVEVLRDQRPGQQQQQQQQRQARGQRTAALAVEVLGEPVRTSNNRIDISNTLVRLLQAQPTGSMSQCKSSLTTYLPVGNLQRLEDLWPVFHGNAPIPTRRPEYLDILAKDLAKFWTEISTYGATA